MALSREKTVQMKDFNPELLREQVIALLGTKLRGLTLGGFDFESRFMAHPSTEDKVMTRSHGQPKDVAAPGEIWIDTDPEMDLGEIAQVNAILTNHVSTSKSQFEMKLDEDEAAVQFIRGNLPLRPQTDRDLFLTHMARLLLRERDAL